MSKAGIGVTPWSAPPKKPTITPEAQAEADATAMQESDEASPAMHVPFVGKRAGLNVWLPGHLKLTEKQAVQYAVDRLIEVMYGDAAVPALTWPEPTQHTLTHSDGRLFRMPSVDTLALALRRPASGLAKRMTAANIEAYLT